MTDAELTKYREQIREIVAFAQLAGEERIVLGLGDDYWGEYWIDGSSSGSGILHRVLGPVPPDKRDWLVKKLVMSVLPGFNDHPLVFFEAGRHYRMDRSMLPDALVRDMPAPMLDGRVLCMNVYVLSADFEMPGCGFFSLLWPVAWQAIRKKLIIPTE